ncbi:GGDEF domain-containing protein [Aliivibrio sifiae]|uniref:GGDEF domain-containing protein n=1 Tax=Aliivibrio sifiae TaxID=566293 RepID=A0A2S7X3S5_9GAMM|nr:GGDEF domain-containing protein [Aliivibrio sifiae]PQJ84860.1 hypothetical protein BTO22_15330 [Aliivibrio sifiae]
MRVRLFLTKKVVLLTIAICCIVVIWIVEELHSKQQNFLLNLDLNKFKSINDTYGHAAGDEVLKEVAKRVVAVLRSNDIIARIGGDEYLVLLPRINQKKDIYDLITKIKSAVSDTPIEFNGVLICVDTTIGYSLFNTEMKSIDELLHKADRSMYFYKHR